MNAWFPPGLMSWDSHATSSNIASRGRLTTLKNEKPYSLLIILRLQFFVHCFKDIHSLKWTQFLECEIFQHFKV